jgi:hypothetical protein
MALLAEHVPKHRRKLVGLKGKAHIAGPFEDEILGFTRFGDAREVSLDVSQAGASPFPMKIFSSVSAILLSDVAIASPLRAHQGFGRLAP